MSSDLERIETAYGEWSHSLGLLSRRFEFPLMSKACEITVHAEDRNHPGLTRSQIEAVGMVLGLGAEIVPALARLLYEDYLETVEAVSQETLGTVLSSEEEAWSRSTPGAVFIFIPVHGSSRYRFAILSLEPPWNPEHGVHILIKDGEATERVSADLGTSYYEWREYIAS